MLLQENYNMEAVTECNAQRLLRNASAMNSMTDGLDTMILFRYIMLCICIKGGGFIAS